MSKQDNKDKLRVYEYAKNLNMSSKEIITILKRLNISVNNHMSVMENEAVDAVEKFFRDVKANAAAKRANEGSASVASAPAKSQQPKVQTAGSGNRPAGQAGGQGQGQGGQQRTQQGGSGQQRSGQGGGSSQQRPGGQSQQRSGGGQGQSRPYNNSGGPNRTGGQGGGGNRPSGGGFSSGGSRDQRSGQGQGQGGQRPQAGGASRPAASSAQPATRTPEQRKSHDNRGGQQGNQRVSEGRPNRNAVVPGVDAMDVKANEGVASKRTKPNGRRFDDNRSGGNRGGQGRGGNRYGQRGRQQQPQVRKEKIDNTPKKIIVRGAMTVGELTKLLHKDVSEVIKKLLTLGVMATINQELDLDTIQLIATEFGVDVEIKIRVDEENFELIEEKDQEEDLMERPPVVTIMGHVDHGKTTLLDAIRSTSVTEGEAGGITQHIGAYQVETHGKKITFLDTPGHEAFTSMRARGAQVTDITILVVAADDGVMPQTVEAINHAKAANVPIIVAVNKIDKPGANPDKIKQELTEYQLVPEEWGGDTIFVNLSAKQRTNLDQLLEMILLVSEVQEFKANPDKRARGTVLEAELDKGKGPVARVLIQHGTLRVGDSFIAGVCFGRVRAMVNDKGKRLKEAGPSTPVEITGLTEVPQAGDPFLAYEDERKARDIAEKRASTLRQSEMGANTRVTLDDLHKYIQEGEMKDLNVIIKGDVQGSVGALKGSLEKIEVEGVRVKIIHTGVGAITESDISLASASNAIVIGFNVRPEPMAKVQADQEKVDIRLHRVIYSVIEEIEQAMKGMLDPVFKESVIGHAEVRNTFKISKVGTIAGCMVIDGKITRSAEVRLVRGGIVVFEGKIDSLKRFKDDAKEVAQGYECGITLERYNDLKEGDIIEAFVMETVER
ncbi:translation initiation factor IF-2 [Paenibacillus aurantius]|uniref:Translation initiation factor IF-2 n=1 Tax=Paenibacillus aurantius TaxID=2918900 RepID=A0AA96LI73_9BACL|nr:translation initiation factor IF-2 [Paenibacillus aurantius]WNQ13774.1 translation initiation factor IF-2 [Paenibacillus aurantius]